MASEDLRRRLEMLNGGPLTNVPESPGRDKPEATPREPSARRRGPGAGKARGRKESLLVSELPFACLADCLPGIERRRDESTCYYHVERAIVEHAPWADSLGNDLQHCLDGSTLRQRIRGLAPKRMIVLDIETHGLSPSEPLFLIGLLRIETGKAVCNQFLARTTDEEAGVLAAFGEFARESDLLVTFNGRSFDLPYVLNRAVKKEIAIFPPGNHLDLLLDARARYSRRLPNCRLQTLEQHVCGRQRTGDIPGHAIPAAYRDFIRTGNAAAIGVIAQHNLLDLVTTAELLTHFWAAD